MLAVPRQISPNEIHIHEINVVTPIKKQVTAYTNIANHSPESLPIVQLGRIDNKLYALDNFNVIYGARLSKLDNISSEIIDFKNETEFIIQHVKLNKNPTGLNQFSLFKVIDYLSSHQIPKEKALELLQINNTIHHKLIDLELHPDVINQLEEFHIYLSEKLTTVTIPYYIPYLISKFEKSKQLENVLDVITVIKSRNTTDSKFMFPSIEALQILLGKSEEDKSTIITPDNVKPSIQQKKIVDDIISTSKNVTCILGDKDNPTYLFNKKTNSLSTVNTKDTIISLDETPSQKIYALSPNIVKYLELEESDKPVKIKKFSNSSDLITYLQKDSDLQGVVLFK